MAESAYRSADLRRKLQSKEYQERAKLREEVRAYGLEDLEMLQVALEKLDEMNSSRHARVSVREVMERAALAQKMCREGVSQRTQHGGDELSRRALELEVQAKAKRARQDAAYQSRIDVMEKTLRRPPPGLRADIVARDVSALAQDALSVEECTRVKRIQDSEDFVAWFDKQGLYASLKTSAEDLRRKVSAAEALCRKDLDRLVREAEGLRLHAERLGYSEVRDLVQKTIADLEHRRSLDRKLRGDLLEDRLTSACKVLKMCGGLVLAGAVLYVGAVQTSRWLMTAKAEPAEYAEAASSIASPVRADGLLNPRSLPRDAASAVAGHAASFANAAPSYSDRQSSAARTDVAGVLDVAALESYVNAGVASQDDALISLYFVRKGESLSGIAQRLLGNANRYGEIWRRNELRDPNVLAVGQYLDMRGLGAKQEWLKQIPRSELQGVKMAVTAERMGLLEVVQRFYGDPVQGLRDVRESMSVSAFLFLRVR
ncbi:MAG: LysM peptidoglycan-binding domain-containing protein [Nitrosarchaeum sp.]|nr:LysM peptidoglycan-binding domain-containing protein [Nitrosarchaeum sp.]